MNGILSRRFLKSFASGTAFMFAGSAAHYAWLAHHYGISRVIIDLLTVKIEPVEFDISRNRILASMCQSSLEMSFKRLKPPAAVMAARLVVDFGIEDYCVDENGRESIGRSVFTVILTDDRGKEWSCQSVWNRKLADGDGFGDPDRS